MKKLKSATILILITVILASLLYFIPTEKIVSNIPFLKDFYNNTTITVTSPNSKNEVIINGKNYGETPLTLSNFSAGEYEIVLKRVSTNVSFYKTRKFNIDIERNTEVIIDIEIGPADSTAGYLLYYTKSPTSKDKGYLTVQNSPSTSNLFLDSEFLNKTPVNAQSLNSKEYQLKLSESGYEDLQFPVIVRDGFNLNVRSYQFPIPINIESSDE